MCVASWRTAIGPRAAPDAKKHSAAAAATRATIQNPSTPPPRRHGSELTPPYSLQRQSATTPATIAAIGKPRPASGSLKKNIDAKEASKTPPPLFIAVT